MARYLGFADAMTSDLMKNLFKRRMQDASHYTNNESRCYMNEKLGIVEKLVNLQDSVEFQIVSS
jgi:hypothetical protein